MGKMSITGAEPGVGGRPLERAHAHNDYNHNRPLLDALSFGFTSVEADIHLRDGRLYVAHDARDLRPGRTLSRLYLDPLNARVTQVGGSVFRFGTPFTLWIDVKTEAEETYRVLRSVLERYQNILTVYNEDGVRPGAVTAIISGNRSRAILEAESIRYASYDGRLDDLGSTAPPSLMPFISDQWTKHFGWTGRGAMPKVEREKLRAIVEAAYGEGRRVRFWATPDRPNVRREAIWRALADADVDLISSGDLQDLWLFLGQRDPVSAPGPTGRAAPGFRGGAGSS